MFVQGKSQHSESTGHLRICRSLLSAQLYFGSDPQWRVTLRRCPVASPLVTSRTLPSNFVEEQFVLR